MPPPLAFLGEYRDAGGGQGVHIPVDGALRHLQLLGQLPGSDSPLLHQEVEDFKETAVFHRTLICPSTSPMGALMARLARPS